MFAAAWSAVRWNAAPTFLNASCGSAGTVSGSGAVDNRPQVVSTVVPWAAHQAR
ncbi:hypothetical protein OG948_38610 (plasmid) [Embleya sp. NBC_00888]|uniref:hypothetical protein n=1 Tax=Embleya sp. NBC_00888 TaxID=2975960 RepID=UPI0038668DFB|nr:hypothetical protein OG948_38610 [Embleya sp. NBC_00888]